jgi:enoyl-CoA hydratase
MERSMIRHCFYTAHLGRFGNTSETVEGIRALAVDKDHTPRWNPATINEVTNDMVNPFFVSPWPKHAHPLFQLSNV